jgi:hypothetical protein
MDKIKAKEEDSVLWFQHEFGIWPGNSRFADMLKNLPIPKIVSLHTLHFQSNETPVGLRSEQQEFLAMILPHVDAITVFSYGVHRAVTLAFPEYKEKVHVIKHGIHSYPDIVRLSRKEAREQLNDYLLYESNLDSVTKDLLHKQQVLLDPRVVLLGQTGFLCPQKGSELLYKVRNNLQIAIPSRRIISLRIGESRDEIQRKYAEQLRNNNMSNILIEMWLPQNILPIAQRAFDINFYWPYDCTQSGVLAHALGAGAVIAGRDLEGVGETLKEAGQLAETDLSILEVRLKELILNPDLPDRLETNALNYARMFSWENQIDRHYGLARKVLSPSKVSLNSV